MRDLGLVILRGTALVLISPADGQVLFFQPSHSYSLTLHGFHTDWKRLRTHSLKRKSRKHPFVYTADRLQATMQTYHHHVAKAGEAGDVEKSVSGEGLLSACRRENFSCCCR